MSLALIFFGFFLCFCFLLSKIYTLGCLSVLCFLIFYYFSVSTICLFLLFFIFLFFFLFCSVSLSYIWCYYVLYVPCLMFVVILRVKSVLLLSVTINASGCV